MGNAVTFEEKKTIQLEMLKEIDAFCRIHNIKYSLAFGTLLGAIRHKGFIPWDDDVDIMMPLPDMLKFRDEFHSETMKYYDIDTDTQFRYAFARIADTRTYSQAGLIYQSYGVCIDLYTVVSVPDSYEEQHFFYHKAVQLEKISDFWGKWRSRAIRYLPIKTIPFYRRAVRRFTEHLRYSLQYGETKSFYIIAGPICLYPKMSYNTDLFNNTVDVEFEGNKFKAISNYDMYLTLRYGDYMTPPPESQRRPYHGGSYFWR